MERKIGEIFEYNGEWYQCVGGTCRNCSFYYDTVCKNITTIGSTNFGNCHCSLRTDHKSVIFKKLEKVGEPMKIHNRLVLKVKADAYNCMRCCFYSKAKCELTIQECERYDCGEGTKFIEINKEDMEEKKDNYDGYMDKECIPICDALNSIPNVQTTESCCGHCRDRFMIFLACDNPHSLAIIARVFDRRYIGTSQPWHIELQTKDSGAYDYFIHSETKYDSEEVMMKDVNQIIENIEHWCDDKFASHFKGCDDTKHSNSEKIGKNLKPFDPQKAREGKPVCTRDGRKARIICFDAKDTQPIIGLYEKNIDGIVREYLCSYHTDGRMYDDQDTGYDLMMLPEKKEGWVNVYDDTPIYDTKEEALNRRSEFRGYIDTVKVSWEE